ncbi:MAG TPA: DNA polymerase III subunit delta [Tepidisphaeraceae bacterium]|jgi:DNA polymerase III delta subunit|nr:DNA polymerase III subunit delta [Tepidisphaeraceae bacterium]
MSQAASAKPIYALVGSEPFLQLQKLAEVLALLPPDAQRSDFDGEKAELADVLDDLRSFAMFGGAKAVVVRNGDEFLTRCRSQLEDYAAKPSNSATLILRLTSLPKNHRIHKMIAKAGRIESCEPPSDRELPQWILRQGKSAHHVTLTPDAAAMLADLLGGEMGRIDTELAKLALMSDGGKVDAELIAHTVTFQRERQMWDMTNEIASGRPAEALRRWRQLIQTDSSAEFRAVTWLGMWLETVRKALAMKRQGTSDAAICSILRIYPRESQGDFMKTVAAMGEAGVARALDLLIAVDRQSKSGVGAFATNVERFLLQIAADQQNTTKRSGSASRHG